MTDDDAITQLSALAHPLRLGAFRALVRAAPADLSAGEIATRLAAPPSTLSEHLARLRRAGLIRSRRDGTRILYAVDIAGTRDLLGFLTRDCCQGQSHLCGFDPTGGENYHVPQVHSGRIDVPEPVEGG